MKIRTRGKMKHETLHFTVDPSIINLPRSLYWYENKEKKAFDILNALSSGKLDLNQCKKLLDGDAYLITKDGGNSLIYVEKPDKEWKEELKVHKKFLKQKEKEEKEEKEARIKYQEEFEKEIQRNRMDIELELEANLKNIEDEVSVVSISKKSYDDPLDAFLEGDEEEATRLSNIKIAKMAFIQKWSTNDPEEKKRLQDMETHFLTKQYNFVFKGHEYTYKDAARNQGYCPHCDAKAKDFVWNKDKDKESYVGRHDFDKIEFAECFQCPRCNEFFFYHNHRMIIDGKVLEDEE